MSDEKIRTIEIFPWNKNFEVGIAQIDEQHRRLIELLNRLASHLAYGTAAPTIDRLIGELQAYVDYHFSAEETIWRKHFSGDLWLERHEASHGDFIAEVERLYANNAQKPYAVVVEEIVKFLSHWLTYHILEADKRMAKAVLALPMGISFEQAKELANNEMSGATRVLIETIMAMYSQLAERTLELAREIGQRQRMQYELQRAKAKADTANMAKSLFLANMSHEIRTPLTIIGGNVVRLLGEESSPAQEGLLRNIDHAAQLLSELLNDVLEISKIEAGKYELKERVFAVAEVVQNVIEVVRGRVDEKQLQLTTELENMPELLLGDANCLQHALLNYLTNAVKYTERGHIAIHVVAEEEADETVLLRVTVEDSGIGIPPEKLPRLFQPYERLGRNDAAGTGLGLSIVKQFAELMGGEVGVESREGGGSVFWFTGRMRQADELPMETYVREQPLDKASMQALHGLKVLLVEDDPFLVEVSKWMLKQGGMHVECAVNGEQAVAMAAGGDFAVILMDVQMPNMDGIEATRRIRALPACKNTPIVAITADAFITEKDKCLAAGMNGFLAKPVAAQQLYAELHGLLGGGIA